ncbi:MAG: hypothetical protein MUF09_01735 [Candidatus Nanopelagicales bacterium]|nr:hypothetical protein [Candidatus Nanopelagicales bacterium]
MRSTQTQAQGRQPTRPLTDDPNNEATAIRGLWFGLLISIPFWLLMAALALLVF